MLIFGLCILCFRCVKALADGLDCRIHLVRVATSGSRLRGGLNESYRWGRLRSSLGERHPCCREYRDRCSTVEGASVGGAGYSSDSCVTDLATSGWCSAAGDTGSLSILCIAGVN